MHSQTTTLLWVVLALTAASIEPILIKMGYRAQANPWQLLALKNIVAAIVMFFLSSGQLKAIPAIFGKSSMDSSKSTDEPNSAGVPRYSATTPFWILVISLLLCSTNVFMLFALQRISAVEFITVTTTTPLAVALVNMYFGNDSRGKMFWFGLIFAIVGVILSIRPGGLSIDLVGLGLALAAVLSSTTYRLRAERLLKTLDSRLLSFCLFAVNGAVALVILPFTGAINSAILVYCLWMGAAAALANLAFIAAIKDLGATRMSIINLIQRPLVVAGAAIALNEHCTITQWLGIAMVLGGVQMAQVRPVKPAKQDPLVVDDEVNTPNFALDDETKVPDEVKS